MKLLILSILLSTYAIAKPLPIKQKKNYRQEKEEPQATLIRAYPKGEYKSDIRPDMCKYELKLKYVVRKAVISKEQDRITVTFETDDLLEHNAAIKTDAFISTLSRLAYVLLTSRGTYIEVTGYDRDSWNMAQKRANAVAGYLCLRGVDRTRVNAVGRVSQAKNTILEVIIFPK